MASRYTVVVRGFYGIMAYLLALGFVALGFFMNVVSDYLSLFFVRRFLSPPPLKTMGIIVVAALAARVAAVLPGVAMTATPRRTRSAAISGSRS